MIDLLAYVADAAILLTYFLTARGRPVRWFHWANAIGCVPIVATEVIASAWPPLVLTAAFGAIGMIGLVGGASDTVNVGTADQPATTVIGGGNANPPRNTERHV